MSLFTRCCLFIFLLASISCDEDPLGENVVKPAFITLEPLDKAEYFADGTSEYTFKAVIDPRVKSEYKNIVFSCTIGSISSAAADKNRTVSINENGEAEIRWKVSDDPGKGVIRATIGEDGIEKFYKEIDIEVQKIEKTIVFTVDKSVPIKANNKSILFLKASINKSLPEKYRKITFKCSKGSFTGTGDGTSREVTVNDAGIASLGWKVGDTPGPVFFSAEIPGVPNSKEEDFFEILEADPPYFKMSILNAEMGKADGASILKIQVTEARNIPENKLKLITNAGTIIDAAGSAIVDNHLVLTQGQNIAYLRMGLKVEDYFIKAQTIKGDVVENITFQPERAYPEKIFAEVQKNGSDFSITAYLRRNNGKVSTETPVEFEAYHIVNGEQQRTGSFRGLQNAKSDESDQKAQVTFTPDKAVSEVLIKITAPRDNSGNNLTEWLTIRI